MTDEIAERFKRETAEHVMEIKHDDGLYRHVRFKNPSYSGYWFDLITWPGVLAFRGDGEGFMFSRMADMFEFFRTFGDGHGINPGYWSEKVVAGHENVKAYSEDVVQALLEERLPEYEERYPDLAAAYEQAKAEYDQLPRAERWPYGSRQEPEEPKSPQAIRQLIDAADWDGDLSYEEGARSLLRELERAGVTSDTWELDLRDFDWWYLWACHAIQWGISRYDVARKAAAA